MKFNNENSKEQMVYVAPKTKVFNVQIKNTLLEGSFGDTGEAGGDGELIEGGSY